MTAAVAKNVSKRGGSVVCVARAYFDGGLVGVENAWVEILKWKIRGCLNGGMDEQ